VARLHIPASADSLAGVRDFVREEMAQHGMDGRTGDAITAVNEAVANVVCHAYPGGHGNVEIEVAASGDAVTFVIRDDGRGPYGHDDTAGSGFGVGIMNAVANEAILTSTPAGGTEVRLTFRH
jgi:two-component sensor histidine kinase